MGARRRKVMDLDEARLRRHALLEDEARWSFVVDDDPRAALRSCREALRLWPRCYEALALHGTILRELGRPLDALRAFRRAVRLYPEGAEVLWEIGEIYEASRRPERALREYRVARSRLKRGERDLRGWIYTGEVRCLLALGRHAEALAVAREGLRSLRGEPELRRLRDLALRRKHLVVVHTGAHR